MSVTFADSPAKAVIDKSSLNSGIIKAQYTSQDSKDTRIMIEKEGKKYTYILKNDGTLESFPLQMGNGSYNISILENIGGTKYSYVLKETVELNLKDPNKVFLSSVQNVNWDETMKAIKKMKEVTKDAKNDTEKISMVYQYVVKNYSYDYVKFKNLPTDYIPVIDRTLAEGKGICYDYSSLFASMLRSAGIPVKLVKGYASNVEGYHAWNEVYISSTGKWIPVDSTFDSQLKAASKKYTMEKNSQLYKTVNIY